jgi:putative tributyrin esterase
MVALLMAFALMIRTPAPKVAPATEQQRASHANGASRRGGKRESVSGSPKGRAPRIMIDDTVQSAAVGPAMQYRVQQPEGYAQSRDRYPGLYLLHGLGGDYLDWSTRTDLARLAARLRLVIVMPEGDNAWYTNGADSGPRFEDYIATDLVQDVERKYRVIRARYGRAIGGLSMGGYGAIKIALRHSTEFAAAGSFSGAFRATEIAYDDSLTKPLKDEIYRVYGPAASETRATNDVSTMALTVPVAGAPVFYLDCGASDPFLASNRDVVSVLQKRGFTYEYHEVPGAHSWEYWNARIAVFLPWVMQQFVHAD